MQHETYSSPLNKSKDSKDRHIWIITGPAGCGKSTVGSHLANELSLPYIEGDEFHPLDNIEKMSSGIPLTDADRWDWLALLRVEAIARLSNGAPGVILTCSALKRKYRDILRAAAQNNSNISVHFVHLHANEELLLSRVQARQGHFMKEEMVRSQFSSLEEPSAEEPDCLVIDVSGTMLEVQQLALNSVQNVLESVVKTTVAQQNQ